MSVVVDGDRGFAIDNRCPHMGFLLNQGSVRDGILTCHWHEARFEISSGCTFDLWADDAVPFDVELREGRVLVRNTPRRAQGRDCQLRQLQQRMAHQIELVQAKSLCTLLDEELEDSVYSDGSDVLANVVEFASKHLDRFSKWMVRLTCVMRMRPFMRPDTRYLGMCYAVRQLAAEGNAGPPRCPCGPISDSEVNTGTLRNWLSQWVTTRHRDAAERTLQTVFADATG